MNFPLGIGISALEKNRFGWLYCDRVHTKKDVISVVVYSEDTVEESLFRIWKDSLNVFNESLSGLELVFEEIQNKILDAIKDDVRYGLDDIFDDISDSVYKNGCFSGSSSRKDKERTVYGKYGFSLLFVQIVIEPIEKCSFSALKSIYRCCIVIHVHFASMPHCCEHPISVSKLNSLIFHIIIQTILYHMESFVSRQG